MLVLGCYRRALSPPGPSSEFEVQVLETEEEVPSSEFEIEVPELEEDSEVLDIAPPEYSSVTEKILLYDSRDSQQYDNKRYDRKRGEISVVYEDLSSEIVLPLPPGYEFLAPYPVASYAVDSIDLKSPVDVSVEDAELEV